ncbi:hypothetical protein [Rhizobium sp. Root1220]|nr:hypothetical protein [Rhizobium sp. Root1220]
MTTTNALTGERSPVTSPDEIGEPIDPSRTTFDDGSTFDDGADFDD